jgi:hypothetical protein
LIKNISFLSEFFKISSVRRHIINQSLKLYCLEEYMLHKNIELENRLSLSMLEAVVVDESVKLVLKNIAIQLISAVLTPMENELKKNDDFSKLSGKWPELITSLAEEHTAEKRQYGALYPEKKFSKEIISSLKNINQFIADLKSTLLNVENVKTTDDVAIVIKILIELGYTYYENPSLHTEEFKRIDLAIGSTPEELDIRLFRTELKQPEQFALSFGIGVSEGDLSLQSSKNGRNAGKAAFGMVSMSERLELLCQLYDSKPSDKLAEKMRYYKIPLDKKGRGSIEEHAKRLKTWFEKLAIDPSTKMTFPLVASVSRSMTRLLVSLHDIRAFYKNDGAFDFDTSQVFSNCIMAYLVHAGHHSMLEVAEVYNRLCDLVAIDMLENTSGKKVTEKDLPYYHIGDYSTLFHNRYKKNILSSQPKEHETRYGFINKSS